MSSIIKDSNGQLVPTVFRPGVSQTFTVTNSSAQSAAFGQPDDAEQYGYDLFRIARRQDGRH
jgi:hypothetical protein